MPIDALKTIWPEWEIEKQLGKGSYGAVYKAVRKDHNVESYAAIKVISIPTDSSEIDSLRSEGLDMDATKTYLQGLVDDFVSEIRLMESLKGMQNIVSVEDYRVIEKSDEVGWDIFIRMELLIPFNTYICDKKLSETDIIKLGIDICTALEICGRRDIIHRDIKPENIFINDFGYFKLGDFGIARKLENVSGGLSQKGTINYMAPEVANSDEYDARVDIYSLGIVLYRLLNGNRLPFLDSEKQLLNPNERRNAVERRIRGETLPPPCNASYEMADVVLRACAFDPEKRFSSATEMKQALICVGNGNWHVTSTAARKKEEIHMKQKTKNSDSDPKINSFGNPRKKNKFPKIIAALLVIAILIGAAVFAVPRAVAVFGEGGMQEEMDTLLPETSTVGEIEASAGNADETGTEPETDADLRAGESVKAENEEVNMAALEQAASFAEAGDYTSAMAVIERAQIAYGDNEDYQSALNQYRIAYLSEVITGADSLAENGDFLGAAELVEAAVNVIGEEEELTLRMQAYEEAYVADIISQADSMLDDGELDGAEDLVSTAMGYYADNEQLKEERDKIQSFRPVYLLDEVTPYITASTYKEPAMFTMGGQVYTHGFTCKSLNKAPLGSVTYFNLEGKYSSMSFTAGIVTDNERTVTFSFYGDGELIDSVSMNSGDLPVDHSIALDGCNQLMISIYDKGNTVKGEYGLANILVQKNGAYSDSDTQIVLEGDEQYLLDIVEPYQTSGGYKAADMVTMGGMTFTHGFTCRGNGKEAVGNEVYFNVDGKYTTLSFVAGIVQDKNKTATVSIYADRELIYYFDMESASLPTRHSVNIKNCKQLLISVYDGSSSASGTYGLAELIVE